MYGFVDSVLAAGLVVGAVMLDCSAATYTDNASGDWTNAATWSPPGVPGAVDDVRIENNSDVTVSSAVACSNLVVTEGNLIVQNGASLVMSGPNCYWSQTGLGDDQIRPSGTVTHKGTLTYTNDGINIIEKFYGTWIENGTFIHTGQGYLRIRGTKFIFNDGAKLRLAGNGAEFQMDDQWSPVETEFWGGSSLEVDLPNAANIAGAQFDDTLVLDTNSAIHVKKGILNLSLAGAGGLDDRGCTVTVDEGSRINLSVAAANQLWGSGGETVFTGGGELHVVSGCFWSGAGGVVFDENLHVTWHSATPGWLQANDGPIWIQGEHTVLGGGFWGRTGGASPIKISGLFDVQSSATLSLRGYMDVEVLDGGEWRFSTNGVLTMDLYGGGGSDVYIRSGGTFSCCTGTGLTATVSSSLSPDRIHVETGGIIEVTSGTLQIDDVDDFEPYNANALNTGNYYVLDGGTGAELDIVGASIAKIGAGARVILGGVNPEMTGIDALTTVEGRFGTRDGYWCPTGGSLDAGDAELEFGLAAGTNAGINVNGDLDIDNLTVAIHDEGMRPGSYPVMTYTGDLTWNRNVTFTNATETPFSFVLSTNSPGVIVLKVRAPGTVIVVQ